MNDLDAQARTFCPFTEACNQKSNEECGYCLEKLGKTKTKTKTITFGDARTVLAARGTIVKREGWIIRKYRCQWEKYSTLKIRRVRL